MSYGAGGGQGTPMRLPDFDMSSARRDDTPSGGVYGSGAPQLTPGGGAATQRENEQKFAKLVAESEYKLLEERARAHDREAKLKEDLAKERANIPKLVNERVEQILRERGTTSGGGSGPQHFSVDDANQENAVEVRQLRQQLAETQRLLQDSERRYQQEKRELLNVRTAQLKNESSKRGQEGDIIGKAMQVMSEYETIVRSSEENSLARLAHHMEAFEKEWVARSKEFEEKKSDFEMAIMTKALDALKANNKDVEVIGEQIMEKTLELLRAQSSQRLELEQQVLEHSETFKVQYKEMLDREFENRCKQYDTALADRERNLIKIVQAERDKIISLEKETVEKAESSHVQCLTEAMQDISQLREQLVREHQEQQSKAVNDLVARREEMRAEQNEIIAQANERVQKVEKQCFEAVESAQKALKQMQIQISQREAELSKKLVEHDSEKEQAQLKAMAGVREEVETEWKKVVEELRGHHLDEIHRIQTETQERIDKEHSDQFTREQELRRSYDARMQNTETAAEKRWAARLTESQRTIDRHIEVIDTLREENEGLNHQLANLQQQFNVRENEFATKVTSMQRDHEQLWHRKLEEMRMRYDKLLDEALGGPQGESVTRAEHEKVLESLREMEERCVEMRKTEVDRIGRERAQLNEIWKGRLDQERAERAVWEEDQLKKLTELRVEIEADSRRKETELLRRLEQERLRLHDEALKRTVEDRKDRDSFEERLRDEFRVKVREAEDELNQAYADKVKILERRIEEREVEIEKRRKDLRNEQLEFEERCKSQAEEWLEREKETILTDVKKFHERLVSDQEKMEEERLAFEQKTSMKYADMFEQSKAELQQGMLGVTAMHVQYWQRCEQEWLNFRQEEMGILYHLRSDHEAKMMQFVHESAKQAQNEADALLAAEREALDQKEAAMYAEIERSRLAQEAASRERALRLLDERNKIQEEAEKERLAEEARLWEELEKKVLEKERQAEADRRVLELDLRGRYEQMINSERTRVDTLMEAHRKEAKDLFEKHEQSIRERDEEWHKQRLAIELEQKDSHEQQYHQLRTQCENRVAEERKRFESALKVRESEFEMERQRILNSLDTQFKDHEKSTRTAMSSMKEDYEKRLRQLLQEGQHNREEYVANIADMERKSQDQRDQYENEAAHRFDSAINELRSQLERRAKDQQIKELEAKDALEKARRQYEERINQQYEELLKDHEERLMQMQSDRESKVLALEEEHQEHLIKVRQEMERSLQTYFSTADGRARDSAETTRAQFQKKLDEFHGIVNEERRRRIEAEQALSETREELESLRTGVEQHKLEVHRSVQAKFEKLFADLREKTRHEREELARQQLEDEERRLAKELLKRDSELRRETQEEALRARESHDRTVNASLTATAPRAGGTGYGAGSTPNVSSATAGGGASTTNWNVQRVGGSRSGSEAGDQPPQDERVVSELIAKRREKLKQLWQVLDYSVGLRNTFLDKIHGYPPSKMLDEINAEIKKLELQLPLLEAITRRDCVIHRLQEIDRSGGAPQQREELSRELSRLTEHLKTEIPKHEQRYSTKFLFRGVRYMDQLLEEEAAEGAGYGGISGRR